MPQNQQLNRPQQQTTVQKEPSGQATISRSNTSDLADLPFLAGRVISQIGIFESRAIPFNQSTGGEYTSQTRGSQSIEEVGGNRTIQPPQPVSSGLGVVSNSRLGRKASRGQTTGSGNSHHTFQAFSVQHTTEILKEKFGEATHSWKTQIPKTGENVSACGQ
ncbi:unnamed protein product [Protopolystoma xenopodis]|uniref:Uncharacterized protein n=1 Tax=Protopolystoma xenopodis TaxID=117903 RepID=A0A448WI25_9PLAT|nr:unnamed protein product [Protopolystoma xenopodis]